jgi:hypothetical protein
MNRENKNKKEIEELVNRLTEIVRNDPDSGNGKAVEGLMTALWGIIRHKQSNIAEQAMTQLNAELRKQFENLHKRMDIIENGDHEEEIHEDSPSLTNPYNTNPFTSRLPGGVSPEDY